MAKLSEIQTPTAVLSRIEQLSALPERRPLRKVYPSFWQFVRFGFIGILNTGIDILVLNVFLWRFPTHNANLLLGYNSLAYTLGAANSFFFNKYWTFRRRQRPTSGELLRFALVSMLGILCNDSILWVAARVLHPFLANGFLWANTSKVLAVLGTMIISYLGMRLWVFAARMEANKEKLARSTLSSASAATGVQDRQGQQISAKERMMSIAYSLSVVMPAHNEEVAIADTVRSAIDAVSTWTEDFEVIVVNDGSKDRTRAILEEIAAEDPRVRVINHEVNKGYGAALVSGFGAASKDLIFFMDSDGQFDIYDLERFFPLIDTYDAVLGCRIDRQDTWMRKLNAWGWKMLVRLVFKLRVRDIDCAFKLYKSQFFREHRLETRGAMINTEILYKFTRAGYTYTQVGVHHLPRRGGRATGAKLSVIARAFREMFVYARKWNREEREVQNKA